MPSRTLATLRSPYFFAELRQFKQSWLMLFLLELDDHCAIIDLRHSHFHVGHAFDSIRVLHVLPDFVGSMGSHAFVETITYRRPCKLLPVLEPRNGFFRSRNGKRSTNSHNRRSTAKSRRRAHSGCSQNGIGGSEAKSDDRRCALHQREQEIVVCSQIVHVATKAS